MVRGHICASRTLGTRIPQYHSISCGNDVDSGGRGIENEDKAQEDSTPGQNIIVVFKFKRTIRRSGGSAAIAIPPEVLSALNWKVGDVIEIYLEEQKLVVKKV